ncbi:hypothetical protein [Xanthomonas campestris]|uniref:hypothetical protein n=1 Tax=Xanthomonas cannabis TaxID=1885674 RepID=UPI001E331FFA|nr:hypothetical protein [Xanthomonas campestris pv. zinniae]
MPQPRHPCRLITDLAAASLIVAGLGKKNEGPMHSEYFAGDFVRSKDFSNLNTHTSHGLLARVRAIRIASSSFQVS